MQDSPRLYIDPQGFSDFVANADLPLSPNHARYLGTVLRLEAGAEVRVFNAQAGEWRAEIEAIRKDRGSLRLISQDRPPSLEQGPTLVFAPLKRDATDTVLRMGTELGVSRFVPVVTERTNTHRLNIERLQSTAIEAAEQCERLDVPKIDELRELSVVLSEWNADMPLYAALEREGLSDSKKIEKPYGVLIGPEGGFSANERQFLLRQPFVRAISLGSLILRADTAACAALALLAFRGQESL